MGNLCMSMSKEDVIAAKASKEVDQANEAAFKKVCTWAESAHPTFRPPAWPT